MRSDAQPGVGRLKDVGKGFLAEFALTPDNEGREVPKARSFQNEVDFVARRIARDGDAPALQKACQNGFNVLKKRKGLRRYQAHVVTLLGCQERLQGNAHPALGELLARAFSEMREAQIVAIFLQFVSPLRKCGRIGPVVELLGVAEAPIEVPNERGFSRQHVDGKAHAARLQNDTRWRNQ